MAVFKGGSVADGWRIDCEGAVDFNGTQDSQSKPQMGTRRKLLVAGASQARRGDIAGAAMEIVNNFYCDDRVECPERDRKNVHCEYWQLMVCLLAERCARAENLAEIERSRRFGGGEYDDSRSVDEDWLRSVGATIHTDGRWMIYHETWPIFLSRSNGEPDTWVAYIDESYFPIDIHSRLQVRGLIRNCQEI